jgi:citrate lyase gamma subunit
MHEQHLRPNEHNEPELEVKLTSYNEHQYDKAIKKFVREIIVELKYEI